MPRWPRPRRSRGHSRRSTRPTLARWKAEQAAEREAYRQAEAERWADRIPVTDAELERAREKDAERAEAENDGRPEASPQRAADEANLAEAGPSSSASAS